MGGQSGPKVETSILNPSNCFHIMLLFARVLPLVGILAILDYIWRHNGPKTSQKGPFHACCIDTQNFENFYLNNHKCSSDETYHDYVSS